MRRKKLRRNQVKTYGKRLHAFFLDQDGNKNRKNIFYMNYKKSVKTKERITVMKRDILDIDGKRREEAIEMETGEETGRWKNYNLGFLTN